jgi:SRSO17 transposase
MAERLVPAVPPPSGRPAQRNIAPRQVEGLLGKLERYYAQFGRDFRRAEQRFWALKYAQGQLLELERKSIEPMATALVGGNVQAMQQLISDSPWSDATVIEHHQARVAETLGQLEGVLIFDGCDFPKQGDESVGVAWQYCGALGKVANCQASVVAAYASERGFTLLDRRLFMPEEWFDAAHRPRWPHWGIPTDLTYKTRPELAGEIFQAICARGVLPFAWVAMDEGFGKSPSLLNQIQAANRRYFAEIPRTTHAWRHRPRVCPPHPSATGRPPKHPRLAPGQPASQRVDDLVRAWPAKTWRAYIIHEGSKGPLEVEVACVRVVMAEEDLPGRDEWLVVRRQSREQPISEWKFYRSNAPASTSPKTLARLTAWRWPVETVIEECKGELGYDHYEVRGWRGWHHHTALTLLAHHFLVEVRLEMGDQAPALTVAQVRRRLQVVLPKREFDARAALAELERIQRQNYAAYRSHRKRRRHHRTYQSTLPN